MITIETNPRSPKNGIARPALEIRFHFVDGSRETFIQANAKAAELIRQRIHLSNVFHQSRIVVADDYSKSVFVCDQLNRVDFIFNHPGFAKIPPDHIELVELTESEFRERVPLDDPARLEKRSQRRQVGDLLVSFLHLRMRGGSHVYLMKETVVKIPAESQSFMQHLLSKGAYSIRLHGGGQGILNLQNLIGYSVYPGVPEIPIDSWMAQPQAAVSE